MEAPRTFYEFSDRVAAERKKYNADQITKATLAAYITEQRKEFNNYVRVHYPTLSPNQIRYLLSQVKAFLSDAIASKDMDRIAVGINVYAYAAYYLWSIKFETIKEQVANRTIDLSDPYADLKQIVADAETSLTNQKKEYLESATPINKSYLDEAEHYLTVTKIDLDTAMNVKLPNVVRRDLVSVERGN